MDIKVLGTGCAKCNQLVETARRALEQAGIAADVTKVEEIDQIMAYGVMMTPALVIDGEVKSTGKIPEVAQIVSWLTSAAVDG